MYDIKSLLTWMSDDWTITQQLNSTLNAASLTSLRLSSQSRRLHTRAPRSWHVQTSQDTRRVRLRRRPRGEHGNQAEFKVKLILLTEYSEWKQLIFFLLATTAYSCIHIHVEMQHAVGTSFGGIINVLLTHRSQTSTFRFCFQRARLSFFVVVFKWS